MSEIALISLAVQKADWLSTRQSILSENVANANTPNYKAKEIIPFESFLSDTSFKMATSNGRHLQVAASAVETPRSDQDQRGEKVHSGNSVSLENELLKLGETTSQFALNIGLIKSFNRMIMASLKG